MNNIQMLDQIRSMNRAFLRDTGQALNLEEGARIIAENSDSDVIVVDKEGRLLAAHPAGEKFEEHLEKLVEEGSFSGDSGLMNLIKSQKSLFNEALPAAGAAKKGRKAAAAGGSSAVCSVIPIISGSKHLASLFLYRASADLKEDQAVLVEAGAGLIGIMLLHEAVDRAEEDARNKELAEVAFESLSYSEVEAIREILKNISNNESVVVASKIADGLGITRSVIVNALRKFESAGIIESRSLGMKGTFIRVKNLHALEMVATRSEKLGHFR